MTKLAFERFVKTCNLDKTRPSTDSKALRKAVGEIMKSTAFNELCLSELGYQPNEFELEFSQRKRVAVAETWVTLMFSMRNSSESSE